VGSCTIEANKKVHGEGTFEIVDSFIVDVAEGDLDAFRIATGPLPYVNTEREPRTEDLEEYLPMMRSDWTRFEFTWLRTRSDEWIIDRAEYTGILLGRRKIADVFYVDEGVCVLGLAEFSQEHLGGDNWSELEVSMTREGEVDCLVMPQ